MRAISAYLEVLVHERAECPLVRVIDMRQVHTTKDVLLFWQAALVGTTAVYSVIDSLEKRVLSRFSHRQIVLHTPPLRLRAEVASAAPDSTALAVLSDMLQLPSDGGATAAHDAYAAGWNGSLRAALDDAATTEQLNAHLMASPQSDANPSAPLPSAVKASQVKVYVTCPADHRHSEINQNLWNARSQAQRA